MKALLNSLESPQETRGGEGGAKGSPLALGAGGEVKTRVSFMHNECEKHLLEAPKKLAGRVVSCIYKRRSR